MRMRMEFEVFQEHKHQPREVNNNVTYGIDLVIS